MADTDLEQNNDAAIAEQSASDAKLNDIPIVQQDNSALSQVDYDRQDPKATPFTQTSSLKQAAQSTRMAAIITDVSTDKPGVYTVDVYADGFGTTMTMTEITVYTTDASREYFVDNRVKITMLLGGVGLIIADEISIPTAFGQVLIAVDDVGTFAWDYNRFTQ